MRTVWRLLKPDWRKALFFAIFAFIAVGGHIQAWAFSDIPPKPPLYDLLRPLPIWSVWVMLLFPLVLLSLPLKLAGVDVMTGSFWLFAAANGLYFYLLSCALVAGFDCYRARFPRWLWVSIFLAPPAFLLFHLLLGLVATVISAQPLMSSKSPGLAWIVLSLFSSSLVGSLYLYLLACLGFLIYDFLAGRGLPRPRNRHTKIRG